MHHEEVLDMESWKTEARSVINDIKTHVNFIDISEKKQSTNQCVFLNLRTLEEKDFCVELSSLGFRVVGYRFDEDSGVDEQYFETPYSLLTTISPGYKDSFGNALMDKLNTLCDKN